MSRITNIQFTPAGPDARDRDLLGHVRFTLDGTFVLDRVPVRCWMAGCPAIEIPEAADDDVDPIARQIDERTRRVVRHELIRVLRKRGHVS